MGFSKTTFGNNGNGDQSMGRGKVSVEYSRSAVSKYNLNSRSTLNSIIATATPPLMNYARTVNVLNEDKSSILSGSMLGAHLQGSSSSDNSGSNHSNDLQNIMTPDAFNQVIAESYTRLYGANTNVDRLSVDGDDESSLVDKISPLSAGLGSRTVSGKETNSDYVSLSSHTRRLHQGLPYEEYEVESPVNGYHSEKSHKRHIGTRNLRKE